MVNPRWVETLTGAGRRTIAFDNRGHGASEKPYAPEAYHSGVMAADARNLLDHLGIERADVMGYSMGARIAAHLALESPQRVRRLILGGLGDHLVDGVGLPLGIADAMEADLARRSRRSPCSGCSAPSPTATTGDRAALAACIRGSRQSLSREEVGRISGARRWSRSEPKDAVAGDPCDPRPRCSRAARRSTIEGRDHNLAVGDRSYKAGALAFLDRGSGT